MSCLWQASGRDAQTLLFEALCRRGSLPLAQGDLCHSCGRRLGRRGRGPPGRRGIGAVGGLQVPGGPSLSPGWTGREPFSKKPVPAQVAQSVEQRTENPRVGGSIPPLGTSLSFADLPPRAPISASI